MFPEPTELLLSGCSIESIWTPKIQIKYIDTKNQLADMLTTGNFTRDRWNHLLCLFNISHSSSTDCSEVMSKRTQKDSGEERVTATSKPMMNLDSRCSERTPDVLASTASENPGNTRHESQTPLSPQIEKYDRAGRPVVCAHSSSYSEWNIDKTCLLKSGNLMNWWTIERRDLLWAHSKRTSSTESEIISLDAGLRLDGLPAFDSWDVVMEVLRSSNSTKPPTSPATRNCSRIHTSNPKQKGNRDVDHLSHVDSP